jgi:hypothetical protein
MKKSITIILSLFLLITFKVTSIWNEVLEVTDKNIWNFTIQNADYSSTHYTNDYLI